MFIYQYFQKQDGALAQQYIQTIKYRNLVIDLGNGVKTNAQLTVPAIGKGPKTDLNPPSETRGFESVPALNSGSHTKLRKNLSN